MICIPLFNRIVLAIRMAVLDAYVYLDQVANVYLDVLWEHSVSYQKG